MRASSQHIERTSEHNIQAFSIEPQLFFLLFQHKHQWMTKGTTVDQIQLWYQTYTGSQLSFSNEISSPDSTDPFYLPKQADDQM